jgi:hypothetical protein
MPATLRESIGALAGSAPERLVLMCACVLSWLRGARDATRRSMEPKPYAGDSRGEQRRASRASRREDLSACALVRLCASLAPKRERDSTLHSMELKPYAGDSRGEHRRANRAARREDLSACALVRFPGSEEGERFSAAQHGA